MKSRLAAPTTVTARRILSGSELLNDGWMTIAEGIITGVGEGAPPRPADLELGDRTVIPGFVDMHVHGGGGASYTDGVAEEVRAAARFHRMHGTTTTLTSLVSAAPDALAHQVHALVPLVAAGEIGGIHLEGPWLADSRCGAHDPAALRNPDPAEIDRLLDVGGAAIKMVTLAPELDGGIEAVTKLADAGVVVAIGHTEATYQQTKEAIAAGARVGTHLFNAMRPLRHREPGPVLALLSDERVTVELVGDGVHIHRDLASYVEQVAGPGRIALVTDAMAAAGCSDGSYRLGILDVDVVDAVARVRATGAIAGSTATMDLLFSRAAHGLSHREPATDGVLTDEAIIAASAMCSSTPARAVGLDGVGDLVPGYPADFLAIDDAAHLHAVYQGGVATTDAALL